MRDLLILLVHVIATVARLMGPGGLRSVDRPSLDPVGQCWSFDQLKNKRPVSPDLSSP